MRIKATNGNNLEILKLEDYSGECIDELVEPIIYSPSEWNISPQYTGEKIKICIIDSGSPQHKDIKIIGEQNNFCDNPSKENNNDDKIGHSTIVSGIIGAKNKKGLIGIAPNSKIYYAKVVDKKGYISYNSVVSSILWAVVKDVDIIVMALGSQYDYRVLHDAIIKAYSSGICIFAAAGNDISKKMEINFPARYPEVFSIGNINNKEKVDFVINNKEMYSTCLKNKYIKVSGSSISTAIVAGIASLLIEQLNIPNKYEVPTRINQELNKILK
jgi:subtilisin family serine protease